MGAPKYMEQGSKGPAVTVLLAFLAGWASGCDIPDGFQVDDELGPRGMKLVAAYQEENGLRVEGGCGPEMRASMLAGYNFDFNLAAASVGGPTQFVQLDDAVVSWPVKPEAASGQ